MPHWCHRWVSQPFFDSASGRQLTWRLQEQLHKADPISCCKRCHDDMLCSLVTQSDRLAGQWPDAENVGLSSPVRGHADTHQAAWRSVYACVLPTGCTISYVIVAKMHTLILLYFLNFFRKTCIIFHSIDLVCQHAWSSVDRFNYRRNVFGLLWLYMRRRWYTGRYSSKSKAG
jgi:hypothetical protein